MHGLARLLCLRALRAGAKVFGQSFLGFFVALIRGLSSAAPLPLVSDFDLLVVRRTARGKRIEKKRKTERWR